MQVRRPSFDISGLEPHWAPNIELAQAINANGLVPAYIEPFLIKVFNRAKRLLDPERDRELLADIDWFNRQEAEHYRLHRAFNARIRAAGYEGMRHYEEAYAADYERFFAAKSLRWLLAYCEGFEATGSIVAAAWVDGRVDAHLAGAAQETMELWRWHLAEEYEHRTVAFRLYHRLYGRPRIFAWLFRAAMFVFTARHIQRHISALRGYLLSRDREGMSPAELEASRRREKEAVLIPQGGSRLAFLRVLLPGYDPARIPPPNRLDEVLSAYQNP